MKTETAPFLELRTLKLIEGRAPNHFISTKVADWTSQKARYIHNWRLDDTTESILQVPIGHP